MDQQVQVLQVCPSCCCLPHMLSTSSVVYLICCLPHLLSLTCRLKVCKLLSPWAHERHCACQQFSNTSLYGIHQVLKPHQNLDSKVADAEAICTHLWLLQSLLQCRLQDRCCGHSSWCEGLAQGEFAVCCAEAAQVPRLQHRGVASAAGSCQSSWRPAGNQSTNQSIDQIIQSINQPIN